MSFNTYARKVRKTGLPFSKRRAAFRSCVGSYQWLTKQKFTATYSRYSKHFGFDANTPDIDERLTQAMEALEKERNFFLEKLRSFEKKRIKAKMCGRRSPSKSEREKLYTCDWLVVQGEDK